MGTVQGRREAPEDVEALGLEGMLDLQDPAEPSPPCSQSLLGPAATGAGVDAGGGAQRENRPGAGVGASPCPSTEESLASSRREAAQDESDTRTSPTGAGPAPDTRASAIGERRARFAVGEAIGHYEVIRPLGQGGMGEVYLARDTRLGRRVALKFLLTVDAQRTARFLVEARATAQLSHESIVALHDIAEHEGMPYMVLEYVPGKTLAASLQERLEEGRRAGVPPLRAAELMLPVARALQCAHEAGIVHRDLKPANVMLADSGTVKVLDFGIAKLLDDQDMTAFDIDAHSGEAASAHPGAPAEDGTAMPSLTRTGAVVGTRAYMAPEQWSAEPVDGRADLWAVGLMLYQLVTGEHPLAPLSPEALASVARREVPMPSVRERLPEIGRLGAVIDWCLLKNKAERLGSAKELCDELEAIVRPHAHTQRGGNEDANPYTGLAAFQERDAARFFGRETMVEQVAARLVDQPLLALVGSSGAGKSSLVRAGIIPALKRGGDAWEAFVLRPGPHPLAALAELLLHHSWQRSSQIVDSAPGLRGDPLLSFGENEALVERLRQEPGFLGVQMRSRARRRRERLLLFVDQFEEVYTLAMEDERAAFLACLAGAADDASSPLRVIVSIRQDFLDRVASSSSVLAELVSRGTVLVGPLDRRGMRSALVGPAEAMEHRFESEALVTEMLDALAGAASALPLLQFTAAKLWEGRDRDRRVLTEVTYRAFGGVGGALASHADSVLNTLSAAERRCARMLLLRLVTPERTRAIVLRRELLELGGATAAELDRVLDRLIEARLLMVEGAGKDESTVEMLHESLIVAWPALLRWLEEEQEDAQFRARLRGAAKEWEASGCTEGLLWRGDAAEEARRWNKRQEKKAATLSTRDARYLAAVIALDERDRRRKRRLIAALVGGLSLVVMVVSALAVRSKREAARAEAKSAEAQGQRATAERSAVRARNATRMAAARERQEDPTTVLALLREIEPGPSPRGWAELTRWALGAGVTRVLLRAHEEEVWAVAFNPDGKYLVSASDDNTVRVWNTDGTGQPRVLQGHEDAVYGVAFSPDGRRIVSASKDKTVRVWSADGSGEPLVLRGHEGAVASAAFSPDGDRVVSASKDKTVRVWNADGSGEPLVLRGHEGAVASAAFSPDGAQIVSASEDKTVRVWNADGSGHFIVLRGHDDHVLSAVFSPDGERVASASQDKTVRVWNADGTGQPLVLHGHNEGVWSTAFSPDGERVASASQDKTVRVWNADGAGQPLVLRGHNARVLSAAFSPDGTQVASASFDKTVRLWNIEPAGRPLVLRGHDGVVVSASFSPDGRRIVSGSQDKTVRVWNADGTGQPLVLRGHEDSVFSASFSPDGRRIASASLDKTVRVWNADGAGQPIVLRGHDDRVWLANFSPDGKRVVSASFDKTVRVWSADGTGRPVVLRGHEDYVFSAAFSPDGQRIVSGSRDKTVRVWNADGSGEPLVIRHDAMVYSAAFSPDGRRIISGAYDKIVRVWNADGSGQPLVLRGHEAPPNVRGDRPFTPDGARIVSSSSDGTVRVWNADGTGEPIALHAMARSASWSPDGTRIVAALDDETIVVWSEITPLQGADEPKLWSATTYCMALEVRRILLDFPEEQAHADLERCQRRVREAHDAHAPGR